MWSALASAISRDLGEFASVVTSDASQLVAHVVNLNHPDGGEEVNVDNEEQLPPPTALDDDGAIITAGDEDFEENRLLAEQQARRAASTNVPLEHFQRHLGAAILRLQSDLATYTEPIIDDATADAVIDAETAVEKTLDAERHAIEQWVNRERVEDTDRWRRLVERSTEVHDAFEALKDNEDGCGEEGVEYWFFIRYFWRLSQLRLSYHVNAVELPPPQHRERDPRSSPAAHTGSTVSFLESAAQQQRQSLPARNGVNTTVTDVMEEWDDVDVGTSSGVPNTMHSIANTAAAPPELQASTLVATTTEGGNPSAPSSRSLLEMELQQWREEALRLRARVAELEAQLKASSVTSSQAISSPCPPPSMATTAVRDDSDTPLQQPPQSGGTVVVDMIAVAAPPPVTHVVPPDPLPHTTVAENNVDNDDDDDDWTKLS